MFYRDRSGKPKYFGLVLKMLQKQLERKKGDRSKDYQYPA
jgi:hypothetical protein